MPGISVIATRILIWSPSEGEIRFLALKTGGLGCRRSCMFVDFLDRRVTIFRLMLADGDLRVSPISDGCDR